MLVYQPGVSRCQKMWALGFSPARGPRIRQGTALAVPQFLDLQTGFSR
jgi:hypothetical protein